MLLLSVNPPAPWVPNVIMSPAAGGVLGPVQFPPVFQLLSPAAPVQVSLAATAFRHNAPDSKSRLAN